MATFRPCEKKKIERTAKKERMLEREEKKKRKMVLVILNREMDGGGRFNLLEAVETKRTRNEGSL